VWVARRRLGARLRTCACAFGFRIARAHATLRAVMASASIVLYGNTPITSPYVFSVFVALEEKGLPFEFRLLSLQAGEHLEPQYRSRSLTNRVPTLTHDDFSISESSAITEYLEDCFAPPRYARLYPKDAKERARVRMVQALLRSDFMSIREERSSETVFQGGAAKPLSDGAQGAVDRLYRVASQLIAKDQPSIAGNFSIADVDLSMMLQRLLANGDTMPDHLATYAAAIWQRPSIQRWCALTQYGERHGA
jgi:glutathione S-transferase